MNFLRLKSIPLTLFWLAWLTSIFAKLTENQLLNDTVIPFLTLLLIVEYYKNKGSEEILYYAFLLCLIGDLMIMFEPIYYFVSGLTAYWGASILFLFRILKEFIPSFWEVLREHKWIMWPLCLYVLYFCWVMNFLAPYLGDLLIPVFIYAITLSITCAVSLCAFIKYRTPDTRKLGISYLSLSVAATFIGLNKFYFIEPKLEVIEPFFYGISLYYLFLYFKSKSDGKQIAG